MTDDLEKRQNLTQSLVEFANWQSLAASKGWKLPGNSPLPNESWIAYWQACEAHEKDPTASVPSWPCPIIESNDARTEQIMQEWAVGRLAPK